MGLTWGEWKDITLGDFFDQAEKAQPETTAIQVKFASRAQGRQPADRGRRAKAASVRAAAGKADLVRFAARTMI